MAEKRFDSVQDLASFASSCVEVATRDSSGEEYYRIKTGSPQWVTDLVRAAHDDGSILPDDYRYEFVNAALDAIANSDDEDGQRESVENDVDVYTNSLTKWLASHVSRVGYMQQAIDEYGEFDDAFRLLAASQMSERVEVYASVRDFLNELFEKFQQEYDYEDEQSEEEDEDDAEDANEE